MEMLVCTVFVHGHTPPSATRLEDCVLHLGALCDAPGSVIPVSGETRLDR